MLCSASSADPFCLLPGPARWLLCHRAAPSLHSICLLHPTAPSCLAQPRHQSRLLWQVAGLVDGNDHVLGLAVTAPRCLRYLTHLVDTVADAVDIALVAVVIWTGAKDPVWRRERHKTSSWLHMATSRVKAGCKISAPHYILLLTLDVQPPRRVHGSSLLLQPLPLPWHWGLCSSQIRAGFQATGFWKPSQLRQTKSPC